MFRANGITYLIKQFPRRFFVLHVDLVIRGIIIYSSYFNPSRPNVLNDLGR